ncbi:MAG: hypothetical protein LBI10_08575 [Deltaproteobacteria bacterium]|jgi:hypothetical protein|nr:hypothetical protein [Deltaproteobacteria bacterium]
MDISAILIKLAAKLKKLSDEDLSLIEQGQFNIVFPSKTTDIKVPKKPLTTSSINLDQIFDQLNNSNSREESFEIFKKHKLTKNDISAIGQRFNILFKSKDTKDFMVEKIVHFTIGNKLDNNAILGI